MFIISIPLAGSMSSWDPADFESDRFERVSAHTERRQSWFRENWMESYLELRQFIPVFRSSRWQWLRWLTTLVSEHIITKPGLRSSESPRRICGECGPLDERALLRTWRHSARADRFPEVRILGIMHSLASTFSSLVCEFRGLTCLRRQQTSPLRNYRYLPAYDPM